MVGILSQNVISIYVFIPGNRVLPYQENLKHVALALRLSVKEKLEEHNDVGAEEARNKLL